MIIFITYFFYVLYFYIKNNISLFENLKEHGKRFMRIETVHNSSWDLNYELVLNSGNILVIVSWQHRWFLFSLKKKYILTLHFTFIFYFFLWCSKREWVYYQPFCKCGNLFNRWLIWNLNDDCFSQIEKLVRVKP